MRTARQGRLSRMMAKAGTGDIPPTGAPIWLRRGFLSDPTRLHGFEFQLAGCFRSTTAG
jgi:hypothetical protein